MIKLIKNEVYKMLHKKSLLLLAVFAFLILVVSLTSNIIYSNYGTIKSLEEEKKFYETQLKTYDLDNLDDAKNYPNDKAMLEQINLQLKYNAEYGSPEEYYITSEIKPILNEMYFAYYYQKNDVLYNEAKAELDKKIEILENYDWKKVLLSEKSEIENQIKELESSKNLTGIVVEDVNKEIDILNIQLEVIDVRLEKEIPKARTYKSFILDGYIESAIEYLSVENDESKYENYRELNTKQSYEKNYYETKYNIENDLFYDDDDLELMLNLEGNFAYTDTLIMFVIVILIACAIADEFSSGTIKQLLLKPYTRNQILTSKIIAALIVSFVFSACYIGVSSLSLMIKYDNLSVFSSAVAVYNFNTREVVEMSFAVKCFLRLLYTLPQYLLVFAITLAAAVLFTNTAGALCAGVGIPLLGEFAGMYLSEQIVAWSPFNCMYLEEFFMGMTGTNKFASFGQSLLVLAVTIFVLIIISYVVFKRKDIKNQ